MNEVQDMHGKLQGQTIKQATQLQDYWDLFTL